MKTAKLIPLILLALSSVGSIAMTVAPAHAGGIPCTAGPLCGGGNPNDPEPGKPPHHDPEPDVIPTNVMIIDCHVSGDPVALPDDLKFRNIGSMVIPAGTRVYWLVKATGDHGFYYPPTDILPGKELPDLNVLKAGALTRDNCRSIIM